MVLHFCDLEVCGMRRDGLGGKGRVEEVGSHFRVSAKVCTKCANHYF